MNLGQIEAYELLKEEDLKDINSKGYLLRHKKSGARIAIVKNDDENKVFSIGFRTPPEDHCGTPHIIEHTVLCGSDKFPAKDPFVELVKGSLNTFLNAMTYPDKTIFPVASCNEKDFQNLMDVYMDAVLHPNIYKREEIFLQEGWHYELESVDAPITLNGVVYNEMKGAYSSPDEILSQKMQEALFPDTAYSKDSGGNPDAIPDLTYERFLDFHRKYYHPCNSYIYLYGDLDIEEKLNWLDQKYLSSYEAITLDSELRQQKAFDRPVEVKEYYSIANEEEEKGKTFLSYTTVFGTNLDKEQYIAFDVLDYALLSAPGAPLRQALLDAGIGTDVGGGYDNYTFQPSFTIEAKNADPEQKEEFLRIIRNVLQELVDKGINKKALMAGLNSAEFKFREADFGQFPKGLLYGIQCMDSWLYDEKEPFLHLNCLDTYQYLKDQVETGYFEQLIDKCLLNNPYAAIVTLEPKKGLNAQNDRALAEKLAAYKATLSQEELEELVRATAALKKYQEEPTSKEDLEKIPMLTREDMRKEAMPFENQEVYVDDTLVLHHEMFTGGINYLNLMFDAKNICEEDLVYLGLLKSILGYVDTDRYTYGELANEIDLETGGIYGSIGLYTSVADSDQYELKFEIKSKVLYDKLNVAMELVKEMICHSRFEDEKRLKEILSEKRSRLQNSISAAGNSHSAIRAMSYFSVTEKINDRTSGIGYYLELKELADHFDEHKAEIIAHLKDLMVRIFRPENLMVGCTADASGFEPVACQIRELKKALYQQPVSDRHQELVCEKRNEGFKDASKVQYVSRAGDFKKAGFDYTGELRILKVILSYDYLWINVRVKGGAYGCGSGFLRSGRAYFSSYRDPNLSKTNEIYDQIPEYIRNFEVDERDMTKYIIGTFSDMDTPLNPLARGSRSETAYLCGITYEMIQKERDQILQATQEKIRGLADLIEAALKEDCICVVGNEEKIEEEKELFEQVISL